MSWTVDLVWAFILLLGSAALCGVALAAAHRLHLDRVWLRIAQSLPSPNRVISELSALADAAASQGVLGIESTAAASTIPLLHQGIGMVIVGAPVELVKQDLGEALDRSILRIRRLRRALLWGSQGLLTVSIISVAALQLIAAASVASADILALIPSPLYIAVFIAALGAACLPTVRDWATFPDSGRLMVGTLVIEGICLIGSGKDGRTVTLQLNRLLPSPTEQSRAAVAA